MNRERTQFNYGLLLMIAAGCLLAALLSGFATGAISASPLSLPVLRRLPPLHTTLALAWIFFGTTALVGLFTADASRRALWQSRGAMTMALLFLAAAVGGAVRGSFSGREYLTWPPWASLPLGALFLCSLSAVLQAWPRLLAHSREAAWLLLLGALLLPLGLAEAHLYLVPALARDPGRDLAVQWHALDTVIAAWNILLYGIGMLLLPPRSKPLRGSALFLIAATGILFDFGHHNYPSPQPHLLKIVSFSATMLAFVSFVRHVRTLRRSAGAADGVLAFLRQVEGWTLFAVGTGILMAIPWINVYLHGTYAIAGHTMGCMIGVNSLLILGGGWVWAGADLRERLGLLRWNTMFLALFCLAFIAVGLAKGLLRADHDFLAWNPLLQPWYAVLPVAGLPLIGTLGWMAVDLLRACWNRLRNLAPDALPDAPREAAGPAPAPETVLTRAGSPS